MLYLIVHWFLSALTLVIVAHLVPGFRLASFGSALIASLVIGLVNSTLGLILKVITFPLAIVTFGIFLFVINAFMLKMAAAVVPGFVVEGFAPAFVGAVVIAVVGTVLRQLVFG